MAQNELTTLARLKLELDIDTGDTGSDAYLTILIQESSAACEAYLKRNLKQTSAKEYFEFPCPRFTAFLAYYPVTTVTSVKLVTEETVGVYTEVAALDLRQYLFNKNSGFVDIAGAVSDYASPDLRTLLEVDYTGGYLLPEEADPTLPQDIEAAVVSAARSRYYARNRDPLLKAEMIPDVLALQYYNPQQQSEFYGDGVWRAAGIDTYRNVRLPGDAGDRFQKATDVVIY